jgi:hypothetical protein
MSDNTTSKPEGNQNLQPNTQQTTANIASDETLSCPELGIQQSLS